MNLQRELLHDAQTGVSKGNILEVTELENLYLSVYGTSTSFTITFEGSLDGEHYFSIIGDKLSDYTKSSTITSTLNEGWVFDVTALVSFRANLTTIANGNVSVIVTSVK